MMIGELLKAWRSKKDLNLQDATIGELLKAWRSKKDLNLQDAAEQIGISPATLNRIEGGADADGKTLLRLIIWLFGAEWIKALLK